MEKLKISLISALCLFFIIANPFKSHAREVSGTTTVYDTIMQRLQETEWNDISNVKSLDTNIKTLIQSLEPEGSWTDIPYNNTDQTNWPPLAHLGRLKDLILGYTFKSSSYFGNEILYDKIISALDFWYQKNPVSTNWFMQKIACPQRIGVLLILMHSGEKQIPDTLKNKLTDRMETTGGRPDQQGSQGTGANKIDIATHWVYRGCLKQDPEILSFAFEQVYLPIQLTTGEGMQHDLSYFQHGQQFYTGGYGNSLMRAIGKVATYAEGTQYQLSNEKLTTLLNFARESYLRLIRGKYFLYNVLGRGLTRVGGLDQTSFISTANRIKELDPEHANTYNAAIKRLNGEEPAGYLVKKLHTHYWRADYTLYTSPDYTFDVRMASDRTFRNENGNRENLLGYFLTDGANTIVIDGDEYVDIFPVWDWTKIPGVTAPNKQTIPIPREWGTPGASSFAGGVSDSIHGVTTYFLDDQSATIKTSAKKSWFFVGDEIVCLGSSITSLADETVNTTVNQCLLKGKIIISNAGKQNVFSKETDNFNTAPDWIWHNRVGYVFPDGGNISLSAKEESGTWKTINKYEPDGIQKKEVFNLWINHGEKPAATNYTYIIVPGKSEKEMKAYNHKHLEIVTNNDSIQAVYNKKLNTWFFVFYKSARFSNGKFTIYPDAGCALIVRNPDSNNMDISLADPSQIKTEIKIRVRIPAIPKEKELTCTMPVTPYAGSTIRSVINNQTPDYISK